MLRPADLRFCVAPMMDWTDRHCRRLHRALTRRAVLFTEMVTTGAVIHGDRERLLGFSKPEHPVVVQLGGSDPAALAEAARICAEMGYGSVNLNVGCPSDRVQEGRFGACLMREPALVGECVAAMKAAVRVPVSVKCRIGVDEQEPEEALEALTAAVVSAGTDALVVHARKAWLSGLSPRENREVPPLDYGIVHRLKARRPTLPIVLNGGLATLADAAPHLDALDGVMFGRAAYHDASLLIDVDPVIYGEAPPAADAMAAVLDYLPYVEEQLAAGVRLHAMTRHMLGLFAGVPGARAFRRHLATRAVAPGAGIEVLREALSFVHLARRDAA